MRIPRGHDIIRTLKLYGILGVFLFCPFLLQAQFFLPSDTLNKPRLTFVTAATASGYSGAVIALNRLWYSDYPRSSFQFFNDNDAWLQMDKAGHALTSYQVGRYGYEWLRWSGLKEKKAIWIGGNLGLLFLSSVEVMDGFSAEWGFSMCDMAANAFGTGLFIVQQLAWGEQRMALKFSYSATDYAALRPEALGENNVQQIFKDYNGQTVWLSINPSSFLENPDPFLPWLNVALGYGADGMLGGNYVPEFNDAGQKLPYPPRLRQYYLSLDIDLSRIKTRSHFLKTVFSTVGFLKIPAPSVEFTGDDVKWHWIYF